MRLVGSLAALGKGAFFNVLATMIGGLMVVTLILAFLYVVYGRERRRS